MVFEGETFGVGIAIDSFRQMGTRPSASEVLYRSRMTGASSNGKVFQITFGTGSGPVDLFIFR